MTATSLTQPSGIEPQPISRAHTRNTVHREQSIVNPAGETPTAQVVPLLPPIAMHTNGTLSALPPKTPIVTYTPNLSSWNFSRAPQIALTQNRITIAAASTIAPTIGTTYVPVTQGGTVYPTLLGSSNTGAGTNANLVHFEPCIQPQSRQTSQLGLNTQVRMKHIAELLTKSRKDPFPEWRLDTYDGNPLNWLEWYGQLRSAVDSTQLSQDVKLTYLKTLVTGKAKTAIANFAYGVLCMLKC